MKKLVCALFVILLLWAVPVTFAEETAEPVQTGINGLCSQFTRNASTTITDAITVTNSHPGTLKLQYYSKNQKHWWTKATYELTGETANEKVTLTYPDQWKKWMNTTWRVFIPAADGYAAYTSPAVHITAINIRTIKTQSKALAIYRVSDGKLVYTMNANKRLACASTTKMITALITLEEKKLDNWATFSKKAANTDYGILGAKKGTKVKVRRLLRSLLISSSNDSAACLAEFSSGSIKAFAKKMNARAKKLGCTNTHFVNPHGLTAKGHYSSARDLCVIQNACLKHSLYRKIITSKSWCFHDASGKRYSGTSTDKLLGYRTNFLGGKTGYTDAAGYCFSGVYVRHGETYIFTLLGNPSDTGRWNCAKALVNYLIKYA